MIQIVFTKSIYLFFLVIIPLIIFIHFFSLKKQRYRALRFANFDAIARIRGIEFFSKNLVMLVLTLSILASLIFSLAGAEVLTEIKASPHSFVIAIDTSQSMSADDFSPNRMEAAKKVAAEFVDFSPIESKMGIISFSGNSLIEQEMTTSKPQLREAISGIFLSGVGGTDIYGAVTSGTNLLVNEESGVIILMSDGQLNVGSIEEAIEYANQKGVVVHTLAIGTEEGGEAIYGTSKLEKEALQALAYNTGGNFYESFDEISLSNSLRNAYEESKIKIRLNIQDYLLVFAAVLIFLQYYLMNTRYKVLP